MEIDGIITAVKTGRKNTLSPKLEGLVEKSRT
jgi:hypothetical protein